MTCKEAITSEQTYDYVTDFPAGELPAIDGLQCSIAVNDQFHVLYVDNGYLPSLENNVLEYQGIPKLYGLTQIGGDEILYAGGRQPEPFDPAALISSGISPAGKSVT